MAVSKSLQTSGEAEEVYIFQISAIAEKLQLLKYFMHSQACEILHRILLKPLPEKDFEVGSD